MPVLAKMDDDLFLQYVDKQDIEDIQYITYLLMARAGLRALEFYDPATKKHGQAHMQARYGDPEVLIYLHDLFAVGWASPNTLSNLALLDLKK
jgi:Peptidase family M49